MTQQPEHGHSTLIPSLEAKLRRLAGGLTPEDEAQLRAMQVHAGSDELSPSLQVKFQQCAAGLTQEEATQVRLLLQLAAAGSASGEATDTMGHAAAVYEGDPGNKGRPQPGVPANAAGRDPAGVVSSTGRNLMMLIRPLGTIVQSPLPF